MDLHLLNIKILNHILKFLTEIQLFVYRRKLKNHNFTILANNCVGAMIYHDLKEPFNTPFINNGLLDPDDFFTFCEHLEYYASIPLYPAKTNFTTPFCELRGKFGTLLLNCLHYPSEEEAIKKWYERRTRINYDNVFIIMEVWNITPDIIEKFDKLKWKNKVLISSVDGENHFQMPKDFYQTDYHFGKILEKTRWGIHRYLECFDYVRFLNGEGIHTRKMWFY